MESRVNYIQYLSHIIIIIIIMWMSNAGRIHTI